jgi:hypothetical protein
VIQPVGVIFKGSGFYVTDNKGKSSTGIPGGKKEESTASDSNRSGASATNAAPASGTPAATNTSKSDSGTGSTQGSNATAGPSKRDG